MKTQVGKAKQQFAKKAKEKDQERDGRKKVRLKPLPREKYRKFLLEEDEEQ